MTDLRETLKLLQTLDSKHPDDDEKLLLALREQLKPDDPLYQALLQRAKVGATRKGLERGITRGGGLHGFGPHGTGGGLNDKYNDDNGENET
ncbi:hypothetical protein QUF61_02915 [Candidatus Venteria ishoeyi]|uniref:hypothetical protein n=1 Tax=Candidatus Venteria ishoeyi TaxID=1899563 RepID=UPI0025A5D8E2|nr:hypothetical protein [Candidatus Venteria ishoeyi]MDM8545423.1 hypothetical protein [Candidatus Venteria ishoeyi]